MLRPVSDPDPTEARSPAVYRSGLSSARRELQAGTARRHRTEAAPDTVAPITPTVPAAELRTQQAGVRAALRELRQHRGPR